MTQALIAALAIGMAASAGVADVFNVTRDAGINCADAYDNQGAVSDVRTAKWGAQESYVMDFDTAAIKTFLGSDPISDYSFTLYLMPSGGWPTSPASVDVQTINTNYDWAEGDDTQCFNSFGWTEGTPAATGEYAQTYWVDVGGTPTLDTGNCVAWTREDGTPESTFRYMPATFTNSTPLTASSADHGSYVSVALDENLVNDLLNNAKNRGLRMYRADGSENIKSYTREASVGQRPYLEVVYVGGTVTVAFDLATSNGDEGVTPANLSVSLSESSGDTITVDYAVTGGSATGGGVDYTLNPGQVVFDPGQTTKNIPITIVDDGDPEGNETIEVTLSNPTNADLGATTVHTYTINDNDGAVTVAFDLATSSGDESVTPANLSVSLSESSGDTVTVDYAATGGTATGGGVDYTLNSGQLTFDPGQTTKNIPVTIVDDQQDESSETVQVTLSNPTGATLGSPTVHTYTILDNDGTGQTWDVYTIGQLENATRNYASGDEILIHPGTYILDAYLQLNTDDVVIRGSTGDPDDVTLQGPGMNVDLDPKEGLVIRGNDVTVMDLTVAGIYNNGIHIAGELGIDRTWISNVTTLNCGERHIKGSKGDAIVDDVIIENVYMLQTEARQSRPGHSVDPDNYIGGIDAMACRNWIVRDNVAEGIVGASNGGRGAIFLWNGVENVTIERNRILNCATGISIGNPSGPTGSHVDPWHSVGGIIRNNFIVRGDAIALDMCNTKDLKVYSNTFYSDNASYFRTLQVYDEASEGQTTNLDFANNIIRGDINDLSSGDWSAATVAAMGNIVDTSGSQVTSSWFADISTADFHLTASATDAIDQGAVLADVTDDFDKQPRGSQPDMGGDESNPPGSLPVVTLSATDANAAEEAQDPGVFTVSRDQTSGNLVVYYSVGGTAGSGDYEETLSGSVTILDGQPSKTITITPVDDGEVESNETVVLTLTGDAAYNIGSPSSDAVTIADNDAYPDVEFDLTASSGDESVTPASLTVSLSAAYPATVTVDYAVTGGDATGGGVDYTLAAGTLTFDPNDVSEAINISIVDDGDVESDETIEVTLSNPSNATLGANTVHTYTILDNDVGLPSVEFDLTSSSDDESFTPASLSVSLSAASAQTVTVDYAVTGGDATGGGVDYTLAAGTLTFDPYDTSETIDITIVDDGDVESDETIEVTLSDPSNATLGTNTVHTYTINDNDVYPTVAFDLVSSSGDESVTPASLSVSLSAAYVETVTVDYAVTGGDATGGGVDYTLAAGTLTFDPNDTSETITINIVDDGEDESDETIEVTLSNPSNASLGGNTMHTYTILDNDVPLPSVEFDLTSSSGDESVTPASLSVSLSAASAQTVTVDYAVTGGDATGGGVDYTLAAGTLTFDPNDTSETITINIVDDGEDESDETIEVTLSNPSNASLGGNTMHTYTILDNDGVSPPGQASNPSPASGVTKVSRNAILSWTAGSGADSHDVYFGTNPNPGASEFQGNQAGTTFDPGYLGKNTWYYWRIDEVNAGGTTTGAVWSFKTGAK